MKNIFRIVMAVAILFTASCAKEDISSTIGGGEVEVTFTADLGQLGTRLYGEGDNANRVYLGVYEAGEYFPLQLVDYQKGYPVNDGKASITVVLLKDKRYDLVFWAQHYVDNNGDEVNDYAVYGRNWEDRSISVNYDGVLSQDDDRDAFFLVKNNFHAGHDETTFELRRPFAQLRAGISQKDFDYIKANGVTEGLKKSAAKVYGVANVLNLVDCSVDGEETVTFNGAAVPTGDDAKFAVNGVDFYQISMNYLLVNEKKLVDVEYNFSDGKTDYFRPYYNVPVQRNYRTNIIGQLISSPMDFNVIINPEFEGEHNDVWDGQSVDAPAQNAEGQYVVATPANLAWLAAAVNGTLSRSSEPMTFLGETFVLTEDIELGFKAWTPIGGSSSHSGTFRGTFDGNGKTISGLKVDSADAAGLFGKVSPVAIKNLTINGAEISGNHYAGALVAWIQGVDKNHRCAVTNCHVENVKVALTTEQVNGQWDNGDKAGALIGYAVRTDIDNCSVNNAEVSAFRDLGGLVGHLNSAATLKNSSVDNTTICQNLANYYEADVTTVGKTVGRQAADATIENISVGENVVIATVVNSAEELKAAVKRTDAVVSIIIAKDIKGDVTIPQSEGVEITIDGNGHNYDGFITVDGKSMAYETAALTIKNVNFVAESITAEACINLGAKGNNNTRYTSKVTVDGCTFDVAGAVGVKSYTGGDWNLKVLNSTATEKAHSLIQAAGINNISVEGCVIKSKNGLNFNNSTNVTVKQCVANVKGYAVRYGQNSAEANAATTYKIEDSVLKSACEEGDAVIIIRKSESNATLNLVNTTLDGAIQIDNQAKAVVNINGVTTVTSSEELKAALNAGVATIALAPATFEGTFTVNKNVTISSAYADNKATIKGRLEVRSCNPTFNNVKFDRNETDSNAAMQTASNALQYKAVVMIYGDQTNTITFEGCDFYNNKGKNKSAITNVACDLVVKNCYFEGWSSSIYSQANLSVTNSTFNYTGGNNVILSINGCGDTGGKVIFKNNTITNKIFALSQFLSTVGFDNGTYHFDIQGNTGAGFDYYFLNEGRVANKTFAEGSITF